MTTLEQTVRVVRPGTRREVVPSGLLGMVIFVGTEVMFFAGLISAFTISKAGAPRDAWNLPAGQVLPLASTAVNTVALFASGTLLWVAGRQVPGTFLGRRADPARGHRLRSAVRDPPGEGMVGLIGHGVTLRSSALGRSSTSLSGPTRCTPWLRSLVSGWPGGGCAPADCHTNSSLVHRRSGISSFSSGR